MIAQSHPKRPRYEWIRTLALYELPHHADAISPDFWKAIEEATGRLKPSQQKIYSLYRCGMTAPGIAIVMGWKKRSVYVELGRIEAHFRHTPRIQNAIHPNSK